MGQFHAREGWCFERLGEGNVKLLAPGEQVILDPDTWASAVASVTKEGETGETFRLAEALHTGESRIARAMEASGWTKDMIGAAFDAAGAVDTGQRA